MFRSNSRLIRLARGCSYVFLAVFLIFFGFALRILNKSCSLARAEEVQNDLCKQYQRREITGTMCSAMCDEHKLSLEFCGNNRAREGRKDVLIMRCNGCEENGESNRLVMKIQVTERVLNKVTNDVLLKASSVGDMIVRTKKEVKKEIFKQIDKNSIFTSEDYLRGLLGEDYQRLLKHKLDKKAAFMTLKTVLALTMQPEFLTLILFRQASFMPKLYGYCGPAYFVEYTPPITSLGYIVSYNPQSSDLLNMRLQVFSWEDRARLALQFIEIIRHVETLGNQKQLEICDFRPYNIGINNNNTVTFLDSDDCVFDMRTNGNPCAVDAHCTHGNCEVYCDKRTGTCSNRRLNSNLQIACQSLFLGDYELLGLLRSPPEAVREELKDILLRCSYPKKYDTSMVASNKIDHTILNQIKHILIKSINSS